MGTAGGAIIEVERAACHGQVEQRKAHRVAALTLGPGGKPRHDVINIVDAAPQVL